MALAERPGEEIWECTIPGQVFVEVLNHAGRPIDLSAKGKGSRLRLKTEDREIIQERIRDSANDPFRNGMLVRVDSAKPVAAEPEEFSNELADSDLKEIFELDDSEFQVVVPELSEVNLRRMKVMTAEIDTQVSKVKFIEDLLQERYPIGGSVPSYEEMMKSPQ